MDILTVSVSDQLSHRYQLETARSQPGDDLGQRFRGVKATVVDVHHDDRTWLRPA